MTPGPGRPDPGSSDVPTRDASLWRIDPAADALALEAQQEHARTAIERARTEREDAEGAAREHRARQASARWRLVPCCLRFVRGAAAAVIVLVAAAAVTGSPLGSEAVVALVGLTVVIGFPVVLLVDRLLHGRLRRIEHVVLAAVLGAVLGAVMVSGPGSSALLLGAGVVVGAVLGALSRLAAGFRGVALRARRTSPPRATP